MKDNTTQAVQGEDMANGDTLKLARGTGATYVYDTLYREILCLALRPGALLDEVGLAARFNMSRSPVREALIRLASERLVLMLPNRSTIVAPFDLESLPRYLDALSLMQRVTSRLAALERTDDDLIAIQNAQIAFDECAMKGLVTETFEANRDFHAAIAAASKNLYFASFTQNLLGEGMRILHLHAEFIGGIRVVAANGKEHVGIAKAIEDRDPDLAEFLAQKHTERLDDQFLMFLKHRFSENVDLRIYPRVAPNADGR